MNKVEANKVSNNTEKQRFEQKLLKMYINRHLHWFLWKTPWDCSVKSIQLDGSKVVHRDIISWRLQV